MGKNLRKCFWVRKNCVILSLFILVLWNGSIICLATPAELPKEVLIVKNENAMLKRIVKELNNHKTRVAVYYPGIIKDFEEYKALSPTYRPFFEKLAKKDGYTMGTVSGYCVTIMGNEAKYIVFQFSYLTTKRQEKRIDKKVRKIVRHIGKGSRYAKIKKAHDYLVRHMRYDERYYSPYDAFLKKRGLCMAYALAYQRIMQEMNIPCIYIKGKNHAWNMVKLGGYWYNVDVTWDDVGGGRYRYFLKADVDCPQHKRPASKWYASLRKAKRSYPLRN